MYVETVPGLNVKSENIGKKSTIFFGFRLEISTFKKYFTESKTLTGGKFFQKSLTGLILAKVYGPL